MKPGKPQKVFIDASVLIKSGRPPGDMLLKGVYSLVEAGLVDVLTTDLTITEVAKRHAKNDCDQIKGLEKSAIMSVVNAVFGAELPYMNRNELHDRFLEFYKKTTRKMLDGLSAKVLLVDDVHPSKIFDDYARAKGLFTEGGKKNQFPDAFIFERVKSELDTGDKCVVVTADKDFSKAAEGSHCITFLNSLIALFKHFGLQVDSFSISDFLKKEDTALREYVWTEVEERDVFEATDVEAALIIADNILDLHVLKAKAFSPIEQAKGSILAVATLSINLDTHFFYTELTSTEDDLDGEFSVASDSFGQKNINIEMNVSMTIAVDENVMPVGIEEFQTRDFDFTKVQLLS